MRKTTLFSLFFVLISLQLFSQSGIDRIEPPFWWKNMADPSIQLLVYGMDISDLKVWTSEKSLRVNKIHRVDNPNYLFIDLEVVPEFLKEGKNTVDLTFEYQSEIVFTYQYDLWDRKPGSKERKGFDQSDIIYLLMPDRFANGNPDNDDMPGMLEKADRSNPDGRHGGDIQGITERLDYIEDLGVTALWINPLLENNMPAYSYHGYAITDFYKIDPRYGNNKDYLDLVDACHEKGMKVIMDMVFNHCGSNHWFIRDLPMQDWIHQFPEYTSSNYRGETVMDPYASEKDKIKMLTGWFDRTMPDLNQTNEFLANYLVQNSIWWVEYAGLDGIRMDTYPYSYVDFMNEWVVRMEKEYPNFNILGEVWLQKESHTSYFQEGPVYNDGFDSHLQYTTDFPLHYALKDAFNENDGWTNGMAKIYYVLSQDFLYGNAMNRVIFADNHDLSRYFTLLDEDIDKWKMGMAALMTLRGVPMLYYGTEILMTGEEHTGHGYIREDFPGGWNTDATNGFEMTGRTEMQNEAWEYLSTLMNWRNDKEVIHHGKLTHFIPDDGLYVYFRHNEDDAVMVVLNNHDEVEKKVVPADYREITGDYRSIYSIFENESMKITDTITAKPNSVRILELR